MDTLTVAELIKRSHETAVEKGWWDDDVPEVDKSLAAKLLLIVSEVCEAFEEYRSNRGKAEIYYKGDGKPEGIPVELADAVIRIVDLAEREGMPLIRALVEKMDYNKKRPHRHGGKRA